MNETDKSPFVAFLILKQCETIAFSTHKLLEQDLATYPNNPKLLEF